MYEKALNYNKLTQYPQRKTFHLKQFSTIGVIRLCRKLKFSNSMFFQPILRKPLIFQTILSNRIRSLKYQRSITLACKDKRIRKSSLWQKLSFFVQKQFDSIFIISHWLIDILLVSGRPLLDFLYV